MNEKTREAMKEMAGARIFTHGDDSRIEMQAIIALELDRIATALEKIAEGIRPVTAADLQEPRAWPIEFVEPQDLPEPPPRDPLRQDPTLPEGRHRMRLEPRSD